jgi:hypothetical protein
MKWLQLMKKTCVLVLMLAWVGSGLASAEDRFAGVVTFSEAGFPAVETAVPLDLSTALPGTRQASMEQLPALLGDPATRLLVLPYGSAFPEASWEAIFTFLQRGGNLLVLGGRPFTRSVYRDGSNWKVRDYSVRFTRPLMVDQYQATPGSEGSEYQPNPDMPFQMPRFSWKQAFSPIIRLSAVDLYKRGGAAGSMDARLDALGWGFKGGRKVSAPAVVIDHLRNGFDGGRWIFVNSELTPAFFSQSGSAKTIADLATLALEGSQEFTVRPTVPLYLPGETPEVEIRWYSARPAAEPLTVSIVTYPAGQVSGRQQVTANVETSTLIPLPVPVAKGLHVIEARLLEGRKLRAIYHSGFWVRDEAYLRSGSRLSVNQDYFELDGHPLAVVGTTYMSSEAQRLYFEHPNAYVWDRDLAQIRSAGLNMIRTGWWTGWDKFCDENGEPYEKTLRTLEAFLMSARKNDLPVQFNFFAFLPDILGGANPYLDPQAIRRQKTLISTVVARFHGLPWLVWDFINEPSISQRLWTMRPNGDPIELQAWNAWLNKRYPDRAALAAAWNVPVSAVTGSVPLPEEIEFTPRGMYVGRNSLKIYDFYLFAQDVFRNWVSTMRDAVRAAGSDQPITVGQDEGGIQDRLSPAYWGPLVNFTTNHSWWQNDYVLWDSLMAKQPGQAMLIEETGLQRELNLDETARRTPENEAWLLERKIALSFIQGSGAIEWLWNANSYMTESNETPIGAVLPDGIEKPEAAVLRSFGGFAQSLSPHLHNPEKPAIAVVTSQAAQFSVIQDLQLEAQRKAVRSLAYNDRLSLYTVAENQLDKLGSPRLAILPSPQALTEEAWQTLLGYVRQGGALLVTGPVERDEHWQPTRRLAELKIEAMTEPLVVHNAGLSVGGHVVSLSFDQSKQTWLDALHFADGATVKEIPYGKGWIIWSAYPVELTEGSQAAADLYASVAEKLGISPLFDLYAPLSPGVLVFPTVLPDSVLYIMVSDAAEDAKVDLRDKLTGTRLTFQLGSQRAAIAVIGKQSRRVESKLGF